MSSLLEIKAFSVEGANEIVSEEIERILHLQKRYNLRCELKLKNLRTLKVKKTLYTRATKFKYSIDGFEIVKSDEVDKKLDKTKDLDMDLKSMTDGFVDISIGDDED